MPRQVLRALLALAFTAQLGAGCTITRLYGGVKLRGDVTKLTEGESTRADVLRTLGPPDSIEHQVWGDAFVYRYRQVNSSSIRLDDFLFTGQTIFQFSRTFDNSDTLVVLFDFDGVVSGIGVDRDTEEMPAL